MTDTTIKTKTIMIVDDELMILDMVGDALKYFFGYDVVIANGGIEAIDQYKEQWSKIDCVLLDMKMPGMSGCEVYDHLKQINPNIKVVVMSGYCEEQDKIKMKACGCGYLQKPARPEEINEAIVAMIGE